MRDEYVAEKFEHNGYTVKIIADQHVEDPRKDHDQVGTMVCWHRDYNLGDVTHRRNDDSPDEWLDSLAEDAQPGFIDRWDNAIFSKMVPADPPAEAYTIQRKAWVAAYREARQKILEASYVMLPLGLIDHSGISMYVGSGAHRCDPGGWDSGQVGWIYISKAKAIEEWGGKGKRFTKQVREMATKRLEAEVEEYDQFLTGDVWGYDITDPDGNDIDSCWGFYGIDYCISEAKNACPAEPALKGGESEDEAHEEVLP